MNELQRLRKVELLKQAEKRLTPITATVTYFDGGLPRQKPFTAETEEKLFEDVFWFQAEHYPTILVNKIHYNGKNIEWNKISTYAHYWLGKGRMSFENFKTACLNEPKKATA